MKLASRRHPYSVSKTKLELVHLTDTSSNNGVIPSSLSLISRTDWGLNISRHLSVRQ